MLLLDNPYFYNSSSAFKCLNYIKLFNFISCPLEWMVGLLISIVETNVFKFKNLFNALECNYSICFYKMLMSGPIIHSGGYAQLEMK